MKLTATERPSSETVLAPVRRVERTLDAGDTRDGGETADDVLHRGGDLGVARLDRALALDEHLLAGLLGEVGRLDEHVAALGLAAAGRRLVDLVDPDPPADHGGQHDEHHQPRIAVLRC